MKKWLKPLGLLVLLILICSVVSKVLSGNETLSEYAKRNPQVAYATKEPTPSVAPSDTIMPSALPTATIMPSTVTPAATPLTASNVTDNDNTKLSAMQTEPLYAESPESTHYQYGFYYQALSDELIAKISGISYPISETESDALAIPAINTVADDVTPAVSYEDLRYLNVLYYDFNGEIQNGSLICNQAIAQDLVEIFYELYLNGYQIEKIKLIDEYNGDDTASMLDNNTSCFNYRVVDGSTSLSKHALGCAIDINPFYNPYVVFNKDGTGETYISPAGSEKYADRSLAFPYKIDENDLCYKLFKAHGFIWGGNWNSCKDYQHFQKTI